MFTRGMLQRFADTLPHDDAERLRAELSSVIWADGNPGQVCVSAEGSAAFERAGLAQSYRALLMDSVSFIQPDDLKALAAYTKYLHSRDGEQSDN